MANALSLVLRQEDDRHLEDALFTFDARSPKASALDAPKQSVRARATAEAPEHHFVVLRGLAGVGQFASKPGAGRELTSRRLHRSD
jgi:hypothetical protein